MPNALLAVTALVLAAALAQPAPATTKAGDCFLCEDEPNDTHHDYPLFLNNLEGEAHSHYIGSCANWLSGGEGGHKRYATGSGLEDVVDAAESDSDAMLLTLLGEDSQVRLNTERSALQVIVDNRVLLHYPLDRGRTERLAAAISQ